MSDTEQTKKSTIFYYEWNKLIKMLPDEKKLILYETILSENPTRPEDEQTACIFDFINDKLDENFDKYQDIRRKRQEASRKRWDKNKKPTTDKPQATKPSKSYKAIESMSKELVEIFTKPHCEDFTAHESQELKIIEKFILNNSDNKRMGDDYDLMNDAYVKIRKHLVKTENIYSLTYKANGKREPDETTKEIHKHMEKKKTVSREDLTNASNEQEERAFYSTFWDDYKGKSISILGVDYDVDWEEEQFFLKGTKKTGEFGSGRLMEEVFKSL